jgi:hypothetical protein
MATKEEVANERELAEALAAASKAQEEKIDGKRTELDLTQKHISALERLVASERRTVEQLQSRLVSTRELLKLTEEQDASYGKMQQILSLNKDLREEEVTLARRNLTQARSALATARQAVDAVKDKSRAQQDSAQKELRTATAKARLAALELQAKRETDQVQSRLYTTSANILKTATGISAAWKETAFGAIAQSGAAGFKTMGMTIASLMTPLNMLGATLMKVQESTIALVRSGDQAGSSFAKQTGLLGTNRAALEANYRVLTKISASLADVTGSMVALMTQSGKFIDLTQAQRSSLTQLSVAMDKAGYGSQYLASQLDPLMIGLGMGASSVERFERSMDSMRQSVGMSVQQFKSDLPAALKTAMFYTGNMEQELRGLISTAKSTGVGVSQLQGIVARYDTFEGAAESVGRLNAILGGSYLNSIQMVYATESQRLDLLRASVSASGRQFSTLERYEKKTIMAAAGIQDINTALQIFGQGASAYNAHLQKQQQMEELARQATPVFEQLKELGMRLAIGFRPFLGVMESLVKVFETIIPKTEKTAYVFSGALAVAFSAAAMQARAAAAAMLSSAQTIIAGLGAETAAVNASSAAHARRASMMRLGLAGAGAAGVYASSQSGASGGGRALGGAVSGGIAGGALTGGNPLGIAAGAALGAGTAYFGGMAAGGRTQRGSYMVGERGPEMVSLPQGSNVVSNENIGRMMAASTRSSQQMSQMTSALKSSLDNLSSKLNSVITLDERKANRDRGNVIVLEMDRRVVGQTVVDYINEESELSLTS